MRGRDSAGKGDTYLELLKEAQKVGLPCLHGTARKPYIYCPEEESKHELVMQVPGDRSLGAQPGDGSGAAKRQRVEHGAYVNGAWGTAAPPLHGHGETHVWTYLKKFTLTTQECCCSPSSNVPLTCPPPPPGNVPLGPKKSL